MKAREPRTEAGKNLAADICLDPNGPCTNHLARIVAIEDEAGNRLKIVEEMEREGVVTWGDPRHRERFLSE